ncbi:ArnT family glycosyltransferase [Patescibacteria group bacterium]
MAKTFRFLKKKLAHLYKSKNLITTIFLVLIIFFGNKIRENNYATVPPPGENADEYAYSWVGLSILQGKPPRAWSSFPSAYPKVDREKINVDNIYDKDSLRPDFEMVEPWFDSPPLMGIITSTYAYLKGVRTFDQASIIVTRRPMLKIAMLTTVLIFILGMLLHGKIVGLLSALIYSVSPAIVISNRLLVPENGYTPLFVLLIIMIIQYFRTRKLGYWKFACVIGVVAFFFKFSGIGLLLTLLSSTLIFTDKNRSKILKYTIIAIIMALGLYMLYGYIYNWEVFKNVFISQSNRFYGASSEAFYQAFSGSKVTKNLTDGWLSLGWISFFIISFTSWTKKEIDSKIITVSFFSYLIIFLIMGSEAYGHYRFPFYPILVISVAKVLFDLIKTNNIPLFVTIMLLPFGTTVHRLVGVVGFQTYVPIFRIFIIFSLLILLLGVVKKEWTKSLQKMFMVLVIVFVVWVSIKEIYFYNIDKWYFVN